VSARPPAKKTAGLIEKETERNAILIFDRINRIDRITPKKIL
jgi:hypothetical protein